MDHLLKDTRPPSSFNLTGSRGTYHPLSSSNSPASDYDLELRLSQAQQKEEEQLESAPIARRWDSEMMYHRSTYYWIAFVSLSLELFFEIIAISVTVRAGKKDPNFSRFFITGSYSVICFITAGVLLWWQYKKQVNTTPPSKVNAFSHYILCTITLLCCTLMALLALLLDSKMRNFPTGDIRKVLVPVTVILFIIPAGALYFAANITQRAAVQARGTQPVPLPTPRAAAWTLATTSESQSISMKQLPMKHLSGLFKGLPSSFNLTGRSRGAYQRLPASNIHGSDIDHELTVSEALQDEEKQYHRSTYYWIAFASLCLEFFLCVLGLCKAFGGGKPESPSRNVARFVVTLTYSVISLYSSSILLWWQYKFQGNTNPPSKVNAQAHIALSMSISGACFLAIIFLHSIVDNRPSPSSDIADILAQLMSLLLLISIGALCFASWITYRAAVRVRGTERIPRPPRHPGLVPAWMLATTSESQSVLSEVRIP